MLRTWLSSPIRPSPVPSPNRAVTIGQAHREHRAEADQEDHDRRADADERGVADRGLLRLLDRLAAQLDLQAGRARSRGRGDHPLRRRDRQDVRALVEGDRREADRARPWRSPWRPAAYGLITDVTCGRRAT